MNTDQKKVTYKNSDYLKKTFKSKKLELLKYFKLFKVV